MKCGKMSLQVQNDLISSGFIVNTEKSVWKPTQLLDNKGNNKITELRTILQRESPIS